MVTHNPSSWEDMSEDLPGVQGLVGYSVSHQQKTERKFENKIRFSDSLNAIEKGFIPNLHPLLPTEQL